MAPTAAPAKPPGAFTLPLIYTLFFLTIEPLSTLLGAIYAILFPHTYIHLLSTSISTPSPYHTSLDLLSPITTTILAQLGNLYLLLALLEGSVLRSTADLKVWKTLLFCMLIADVGHVASCYLSMDGVDGFWKVSLWNRLDWGNLGFVYVAAGLRIAFLRGVWLGGAEERIEKKA